MKKLCKCGNTMSDIAVPNKVIYWTYTEETWNLHIRVVKGETLRVHAKAIWYCEKCGRFYNMESTDLKQYTYLPENNEVDSIKCTCREDLYLEKLMKFYSINDFEENEINEKIRKNEPYEFPRKVDYCLKCKRIYIRKNDQLKIFSVEDVIDLKVH